MNNEATIVKEVMKKGIISLIVLDIVGSCMGIFARILEHDLMLFQQVAFRLLSAFIIMNIIFFKQINYKKIKLISKTDWIVIIFRSIAMYMIGITLGSIAFINGKYSNISFIMALPMTALLGIFIFKEKVDLKRICLIFLSFLGVAFISVNNMSNILKWDTSSILALIGISFISLSNILRKYHTDILNDKEITVCMLFISTLLIFSMSFISGEKITNIDWNINLIIVIFLAGLFNGIFILMANYGFSKVNSILANNILALQSIFGVIIGFFLYKELVTIKEIIGGVLIIISIILFNKIKSKV